MQQPTTLLTTSEVAELAGKHRATVTRWVSSGRLTPTRTHPMFLFDRADVEALIGEVSS